MHASAVEVLCTIPYSHMWHDLITKRVYTQLALQDAILWCSVGTTRDLKFTGFVKRETRECESARARERECDYSRSLAVALSLPRTLALSHSRASRFSLAVALSLPRPRTLAFSSLAFFKTSFQTRLRFCAKTSRFYFKNKKARLEIASGPNGTPYWIPTLHDPVLEQPYVYINCKDVKFCNISAKTKIRNYNVISGQKRKMINYLNLVRWESFAT